MRVTRNDIDAVAARIGAEFLPEKVMLFGSHACGTPSPYSDVDLLVIMEHQGSGMSKALEIVRRVKSRIPIDLVVRTPRESRQRLAWNDFFLKEVIERGEVLYESTHCSRYGPEPGAVWRCRLDPLPDGLLAGA